jgi:hypothetical protein
MSIYERRVDQILEEITKWALIEGRVPTAVESTRKLKELLEGKDPSVPRMQLRMQGYKSRFNRSAFNKSFEEAIGDLGLLYAETVDALTRVINGLNADDVNHKALSYQLSIIDDLLESLLLAEPNASGYFFSVFDSFNDLSKADQANTTADIDLASGTVRLPAAGGIKKLDLGFMVDRARANLAFTTPGRVLSSKLIPGTRFGYIFDDIIGDAWGEEIRTDNDNLEIEFTIPVATSSIMGIPQAIRDTATAETISATVSRIEIEPLLASPALVDVFYSLDGQNFTRLPGHEQSVEMLDKRVVCTFGEILIKFLKVRMRKAPDGIAAIGEGAKAYTFQFGLKGLALFNTGFASSGIFQSQLQEPDGPDNLALSRVALDVDELVPTGTNINYFVSLGESSDWHPITPGSRSLEDNRVVEFGNSRLSSRFENHLSQSTTPTVDSTRNGITFYRLYTTGQDIVPRTTRLFRGINSWKRQVNLRKATQSVHNNYVVFTLTDNEQKLYLEVENEKIHNPPASDGTNPTSIPVLNNIFRDESVPVKPIYGVPQENPNYSIRSLIRLYNSSVGGSGASGASIAGIPTLHQARITLPLSLATGRLAIDQYIYLAAGGLATGYYKILTVQEGISVIATVSDPGKLLVNQSNVTWSLGYQDITSQIQDAEQNRIILSASQAILATDELVVTYRMPLGLEHRLITSSVIVKSSTDGGETFQAGRDYVVKAEDKAIARIPEGRMLAQGDQTVVRVDFQYELEEPDLDTYSCFFMVDAAEPKVVELSGQISIDEEAGEAIFIEDGVQVHEVSSKLMWPALPKGWRQVTVKSKPVRNAAGAVDTSTAIYKALILTDVSGRHVFGANGVYFTRMSAFPESLKETNLFKLQTGVHMEDRSWYALDSGKIIINWDPTDVPDTIYPVLSTGPVATLAAIEEFELEYRLRTDVEPERRIRLRAQLERESKTSPSITPELRSYNLKFSY